MKKKMFYGANKIIFGNAKALRNSLTADETVLWVRLKEFFPGHKFRRQHPISNYIADFYCHKLKLVIEVDGSIHMLKANINSDNVRQKNLESMGLKVLRFTNGQVKNKIEFVLQEIDAFIKEEVAKV